MCCAHNIFDGRQICMGLIVLYHCMYQVVIESQGKCQYLDILHLPKSKTCVSLMYMTLNGVCIKVLS